MSWNQEGLTQHMSSIAVAVAAIWGLVRKTARKADARQSLLSDKVDRVLEKVEHLASMVRETREDLQEVRQDAQSANRKLWRIERNSITPDPSAEREESTPIEPRTYHGPVPLKKKP